MPTVRFVARTLHVTVLLAACDSDPANKADSELDGSVPSDAHVTPDLVADASSSEADDADSGRDATANLPADAGPADDSGATVDAGTLRMGFPPVVDVTKNGPFVTQNPSGDNEGPNCVVHRPKTLGEQGLHHPVIVWGMGTGGFNTYQQAFDLWASHGFVVTASLLGDGQGDGAEMLACLDYVCTEYAPNVVCRAGATGHSQGGAGAIMAGVDGRVVATAPIQPYTMQGFGGFDRASFTQQKGPMLLLSGTNDVVATPADNQKPVFDTTNVPVVWANLIGGEHVSTGIDGAASYRSVVLAWFRLQVMDDQDFRGTFYGPDCSLCKDAMWMVQRKGIP